MEVSVGRVQSQNNVLLELFLDFRRNKDTLIYLIPNPEKSDFLLIRRTPLAYQVVALLSLILQL